MCSVISKWLREKQNSLEMLSSAVVGVEALWCHLDCFSFQDGWIGLECNGIGCPCMFILSLLQCIFFKIRSSLNVRGKERGERAGKHCV